MWMSLNVCRNLRSLFRALDRSRRTNKVFRQIVLSFIPVLLLFAVPAPAAAEQLIVRVVLNQEDKGDHFVHQGENGDFLVKSDDVKTIGFRSPSGAVSMINGERCLSLRSMEGVTYVFNEANLSLDITANPSILGKEIIDFQSEQKESVYYPHDTSVFLNYGADYQAGNGLSFTSFNLTNQLGMRMGDVLFLSDSVFTKDQTQDRFLRLQSNFTYDDRLTFRRLIVGDFFASSGNLGSSLNLGGLSFRKVYRMDPSYVYYPTLNLAGQTALPSEAKIYLNGMLIKTERLSPGEFELKNLTPYGAAGTVEVVLRDSFGREQRLDYPFYYADSLLLKKGFNEYSYDLGFTRQDYGTKSNRYSTLAISAFHRYGFSDALTMGFAAEAVSDLYNLGPNLTVKAGRIGLVSLSLAGSFGRSSDSGAAGVATYSYQGLNFGFNLSLAGYTRNFKTIAETQTGERTKYSAGCGLSYGDPLLGSLSLNLATVRKYIGDNRDVGTVSYTRSITAQTSITATYRSVRENGYSNEFLISFNYMPKRNLYVSTRYEQTKEVRNAIVSVQKNPPVGQGLSYRASVKRSESGGSTTWRVNPYLQYNGRYGIYEGGFEGWTSEGEKDSQYHLSVAGSLVYLGKTFGATRPVYDSFGLVNTGGLEGVKVLLNSEEVGSTDSSGKLFIPNLGSYTQNQVVIRDRDIPMDYYISNIKKLVSPPLRSGSCIPFVVKKMQMIFGRLAIRKNGELKPVEFQEVTLIVNGRRIVFPTGSGGEFDIDLSQSDEFKKVLELEERGCTSITDNMNSFLKPGTYQASVLYEGTRHTFNLPIPNSADSLMDLGMVIIDETH
jgi:outer membrane usher protein FimD/PapC